MWYYTETGRIKYAAVLDTNMVYYAINILLHIQDMKTIVADFGRFRYNRLYFGMCMSINILQAKVDELLCYVEGVRIYIGYILVLIK